MDAAGVLALQRSAGNAAVSQALHTQRDGHVHGHWHAVPVQRALTNDQRNYGTAPGTLMRPNAQDQQNLENVFPRDGAGNFQQFPDPVVFGSVLTDSLNRHLHRQAAPGDGPPVLGGGPEAADWVKAINPGREADAYRRNCIDASRSFLASWSGNPTVAVGVVGTTDNDLEAGANERTATWLATRWNYDDVTSPTDLASVWPTVAARLERAGYGSAAIVVFRRWGTDSSHAVCGVNHMGTISWVDAQLGLVSPRSSPLYSGRYYMTITLDPQFSPVDEPPAHSTAISL